MRKCYFYLPPGTFTTVKLISILHKVPEGEEKAPALNIEYNGNSLIKMPEPEIRNNICEWSLDSVPELVSSKLSKFSIYFENDQEKAEIDFDEMNLLFDSKSFDPSSVGDFFIFKFLAGYFVRKVDHEMKSIHLKGTLNFIQKSKFENFKKNIIEMKEKRDELQGKIPDKSFFEYQDQFNKKKNLMRRELYEKHVFQTANTPIMDEKYSIEPSFNNFEDVVGGGANASKEEKVPPATFAIPRPSIQFMIPKPKTSTPPAEANDFSMIHFEREKLAKRRMSLESDMKHSQSMDNTNPTFQADDIRALQKKQLNSSTFPLERIGYKGPSSHEIKVLLQELCLIFPLDLENKTFCGVSFNDQDVRANKTILFNVVHFLTIFSEFTGIVYDYQISVADGMYKLEDRNTRIEAKRDINSKNLNSGPYFEAIMKCLQKIMNEFHLKPKSDDMIDLLFEALQLYTSLAD